MRVVVDRFDDVGHRDGAARHFESLLRPRGDGAVWTLGPFTLFANGGRDDDVMERLTTSLDDAGDRVSCGSARHRARTSASACSRSPASTWPP